MHEREKKNHPKPLVFSYIYLVDGSCGKLPLWLEHLPKNPVSISSS
jgi:hypothetical protein